MQMVRHQRAHAANYESKLCVKDCSEGGLPQCSDCQSATEAVPSPDADIDFTLCTPVEGLPLTPALSGEICGTCGTLSPSPSGDIHQLLASCSEHGVHCMLCLYSDLRPIAAGRISPSGIGDHGRCTWLADEEEAVAALLRTPQLE